MSLIKLVDGVPTPMSAEEEAAIRAEWAENDPASKAPSGPVDPVQKLKNFLAANPDVAKALS